MTRTRLCPHCHGTVAPFKRGVDPDLALYNHIRLSHPDVPARLVIAVPPEVLE